MKKQFFAIIALCLITSAWADNYMILQMNTKTVKIGNRVCKKGDVFSDSSHIDWSDSMQALKTQNLQTKKIKLFVADDFQKKHSKSIIDYYIKNKRQSSRITGLEKMKKTLSNTFYLLDTINIETDIRVDSICYFYVAFQEEGNEVHKALPKDGNYLILDRIMFQNANKYSEMKLTMFYSCKGLEKDYQVTDSMRIVFIPKKIKKK